MWQGPSTTCDGDSKKILCLPPDYSKFDLPYRNDFNIIDIGESAIYRVFLVVARLGWVDLDLEGNCGLLATAAAATFCPSGWFNTPNLSQLSSMVNPTKVCNHQGRPVVVLLQGLPKDWAQVP